MDETQNQDHIEMLDRVCQVTAAYCSSNPVSQADLPGLIIEVHKALIGLNGAAAVQEETRPAPAVPIRRSLTDEAIVCLECGKSFKTIRRHLEAEHGLRPEQYRERWSLPGSYPMVAPSYSARRSSLALRNGLGTKSTKTATPTERKRAKRSSKKKE